MSEAVNFPFCHFFNETIDHHCKVRGFLKALKKFSILSNFIFKKVIKKQTYENKLHILIWKSTH